MSLAAVNISRREPAVVEVAADGWGCSAKRVSGDWFVYRQGSSRAIRESRG